jgi:hypothetical protein
MTAAAPAYRVQLPRCAVRRSASLCLRRRQKKNASLASEAPFLTREQELGFERIAGTGFYFPSALWGGVGGGEELVQASTLLPSSRPPPCPPHKGEGKARKRRCLTSESEEGRRTLRYATVPLGRWSSEPATRHARRSRRCTIQRRARRRAGSRGRGSRSGVGRGLGIARGLGVRGLLRVRLCG